MQYVYMTLVLAMIVLAINWFANQYAEKQKRLLQGGLNGDVTLQEYLPVPKDLQQLTVIGRDYKDVKVNGYGAYKAVENALRRTFPNSKLYLTLGHLALDKHFFHMQNSYLMQDFEENEHLAYSQNFDDRPVRTVNFLLIY